ncbi:flavin reductase family protein [Celeribacter indicus]|uniref:Flavin reductase domain-containing protein n=1 Tax=Celeribacter indicus TaxID=1208324 RepID=A0A0B5E379_9RHOB|nr:flavin reductase family protein [Celeribacter indicus]AJE47845.1 flavin reductase domain-containing protein [Celeribacter indicus]SDW24721.1 NADH-FMN oxidoreductase RutF, flavin reductase (DIM6/NTAB) family [Celeribacter indicus]
MDPLPLSRAFTLIEPGPVVLVTTHDGTRPNIMTITWTMVRGFDASFALTTGSWNHSWRALADSGECVLAIPTADMIDTAVGIGTCSGADTDKFARFGLTPLPARHVGAPLIAECLANIECRVEEIVARLDLVLLRGVAAYIDTGPRDRRLLHAVGDGTFTADGAHFDRSVAMRAKLPDGL